VSSEWWVVIGERLKRSGNPAPAGGLGGCYICGERGAGSRESLEYVIMIP